ncbi:MAG: sulfatase [Candidatus Hydrogenedentales bacterium]|jgi:arylsulfatase A-like enzyme
MRLFEICFVALCSSFLFLTACAPPTPEAIEPASSQDLLTGAEPSHGGEAERPDIIWVLLDACRPDFSCYGNPRPVSPYIDALAEEGCLFESHFAQGLWTQASVPSYMTGKYFPVSCLDFVYLGNSENCPRAVPAGEVLLPRILKDNGYYTVLISAQIFISPRSRLYKAFDEQFVFYPTDGQAYVDLEAMLETISSILEKDRDQPLFLYVHAMDTHFPHVLKAPYDQWVDKRYSGTSIQNGNPIHMEGSHFTPEDQALLRALHDGSILASDHAVGAMVETLKQQGRYDNSFFIIGADHGDALGEDGEHWGHLKAFDEVFQVPLILKGPGVPAGRRISAFTENVDLLPTLIDLFELKTTAQPEGKSLIPLIHGTVDSLRDYVFARWYSRGYDKPTGFIIRDGAHKYEYDPITGHEELFCVPDSLANRIECSAKEPDRVAAFRQVRKEVFEPRWNAYDALEKLYYEFPFTESFLFEESVNADAVELQTVERPTADLVWDNKWKKIKAYLWAAPWISEPQPLYFSCEVPPGRYLLAMHLFSNQNLLDHASSMVRVRMIDEEELRDVRYLIDENWSSAWGLVEVDTVELPDGHFEMEVHAGDAPYWSAIGGFRLTLAETVEAAADMPDDEQLQDQLRALGYL